MKLFIIIISLIIGTIGGVVIAQDNESLEFEYPINTYTYTQTITCTDIQESIGLPVKMIISDEYGIHIVLDNTPSIDELGKLDLEMNIRGLKREGGRTIQDELAELKSEVEILRAEIDAMAVSK